MHTMVLSFNSQSTGRVGTSSVWAKGEKGYPVRFARPQRECRWRRTEARCARMLLPCTQVAEEPLCRLVLSAGYPMRRANKNRQKRRYS